MAASHLVLPPPVMPTTAIADELVLERIPQVATLDECNAILKISRAGATRMRKLGTYPVPEMAPPFDDRPRFAGEDILAEIRRRARYGRLPQRRRA